MSGGLLSKSQWNLRAMARAAAAERLRSPDSCASPIGAAFDPHGRIQVSLSKKCVSLPYSKTYGEKVSCKSKQPGQGKTNGMPWDGTSPVSAPSDPMAKPATKNKQAQDQTFKDRLARAGLPK